MPQHDESNVPERRKRYVPVVGPRLHRLLAIVLGLFALLSVNAVYLVSVTIAGVEYQNWFYLVMFALHLVLGLLLVGPAVAFGIAHMINARNRPNRRAIRAGQALFATALLLFVSGIVLMRVDLFGVRLEVNQPVARSVAYWAHVLAPLALIWLFILHRLAGRRIRWKTGLAWGGVAAAFAIVMLALHSQDPRAWNVAGPASGERYFFPSLARTTTGNFIPERVLRNDEYCRECHADVFDGWTHSAHRLSSFNNPPYVTSVKETRKVVMARDGSVQASRFCAGCHDPVPFFSGAFDDPKFDDPEYDLASDPMAQAGITCTVCHSIGHINSPRGNADYTIDEPIHYPFAFSGNPMLRWVNRQLVKAKPEFHKATFLKPLHRTTQFCGSCHKVHLPPELNAYKWLRGQNHYDPFWLSGVSGQGIASFYYPPKAEASCNRCHMPLETVTDRPNFSARVRDDSGLVKTMNHQFPSANAALPWLLRDQLPDAEGAIEAHRKFLEGVMRVDIFGLRRGGTISGDLVAPIRPEVPPLERGRSYLLETVIRTVKMGHIFTQGTADSNEVWMEVKVSDGDGLIGRSGGRDASTNAVDPWSHFVNAFVIDRQGNRINRRNAQDIFVPLYSNQIPPGAADAVHYRLEVPDDAVGPITVEARLLYRKFDTEYMSIVTGDPGYRNDLPILVLAEDRVSFPLAGESGAPSNADSPIEPWQRWNDYGIGLLLQGDLKGAAAAFTKITEIDPNNPDGWVNLGRVAVQEGDMARARQVLERALQISPKLARANFFYARVLRNDGKYDEAEQHLRTVLAQYPRDRVAVNDLGRILFLQRQYAKAIDVLRGVLEIDPEDLQAHYSLMLCQQGLGNAAEADRERKLYLRFKADEASQTITGPYRRLHPEDNNERQPIHEHTSAKLAPPPGRTVTASKAPLRKGASD